MSRIGPAYEPTGNSAFSKNASAYTGAVSLVGSCFGPDRVPGAAASRVDENTWHL